MKRFLMLLLAFCVLLVSCADETIIENSSTYSESENESTVTEDKLSGGEYVANTSSKKYHTQFCGYALAIKEENRLLTYDIKMLTDKGYTPCESCIARTAE